MALPAPIGVQKEVVALPAEGHVVVLGTAGSGKTTMAIHRAANISNPLVPNNGRTLLVTFNRTLVRYIDFLAVADLVKVDVHTYHRFARGYLAQRGLMGPNSICSERLREELLRDSVAELARLHVGHPLFARPLQFFVDEVAWMSRHGVIEQETT